MEYVLFFSLTTNYNVFRLNLMNDSTKRLENVRTNERGNEKKTADRKQELEFFTLAKQKKNNTRIEM